MGGVVGEGGGWCLSCPKPKSTHPSPLQYPVTHPIAVMVLKRGRSVGASKRAGPAKRAKSAPPARMKSKASLALANILGVEEKTRNIQFTSKSLTNDWNAVVPDSPWVTSSLPLIAQGDGANQRDGRKVLIKRIQLNGFVDRSDAIVSGTTGAPGVCRILLVWDKQANQAVTDATKVMNSGGNGKLDIMDFRNEEYKDRFVVLMDKTLDFSNDAGIWYSTVSGYAYLAPASKRFSFDKYVNIPVTYTSTDGVVGEITDNNLTVCAVTSGYTLYFTANARLTFVG